MKSGEDSLTRLRIKDHGMDMMPEDGEDDEESGLSLFTDRANTADSKTRLKKLPGLTALIAERERGRSGENASEVVEDMSPGGHVNKRRARSRPVSRELLLSAHNTPAFKGGLVRNAQD